MAQAAFTMKDLIEAGAHYGHHTRRWNPKMTPFVFGVKDHVYIIDLDKTVPMLNRALGAIQEVASRGGKVLFVGTKKNAQDVIKEAAETCGQYYVNKRWLGGLLTNWKTVVNSIRKLKKMKEDAVNAESLGLTKKEVGKMDKEVEKLTNYLGGVIEMNGSPDILFVIDVVKEKIAIEEAGKLGIPVVAICDTNADPTGIDYPVPGNDDAIKAIKLYTDLVVKAVLSGLEEQLKRSGADMGAALKSPVEDALEAAKTEPKKEEK